MRAALWAAALAPAAVTIALSACRPPPPNDPRAAYAVEFALQAANTADDAYTRWAERRDAALQQMYDTKRCGTPAREQPACGEVARDSARLAAYNDRWNLILDPVRAAIAAWKSGRPPDPAEVWRGIEDARAVLRELGLL